MCEKEEDYLKRKEYVISIENLEVQMISQDFALLKLSESVARKQYF